MSSMRFAGKRAVALTLLLCFFFCILIIQFFCLQIIDGEKWATHAKNQHQLVVTRPAKRGVFYSNAFAHKNHPERPKPLVIDIPKFHLYVDPLSFSEESKPGAATALAQLLNRSAVQRGVVLSHLKKHARSRRVCSWLDPDEWQRVETWWKSYAKQCGLPRNALYCIKDFKRSYPYGHLLGQVLHTIREGKDRTCMNPIPTGGLEAFFNPLLQGVEEKRLLLRSPRNPLDTGKKLQEAEDGADIQLTVNHMLQAICEEEIEKAVEYAQAHSGWAVLMDPHTGELLALAQYPFFDPNRYNEYFLTLERATHTKMRAITDCFEPGSTMKPLSMAIALMANEECQKKGKPPLFEPEKMVRSDSGIFPGRSKPIKDVRRYKYLNMDLAIQKSSNVYLARLVEKIVQLFGNEWYRDKLEDVFGFGVKTGVELPSETKGMLPTPGKYYKSGRPQWSLPTPYSLAFGYNLLANSLQMARAFAVLANGGYLVKPTLVKHIQKGGTLLYDNTHMERRKVLPTGVAERIVEAMKYNTKIGGSGARGDVVGYTEAGKTGTTEILVNGTYSRSHHFSSFIGFAPAKNPRLLLFIGIYEPSYTSPKGVGKLYFGGRCAAPPFARIMERSLKYLEVPQDDPDKSDWRSESRRLRELFQKWNN